MPAKKNPETIAPVVETIDPKPETEQPVLETKPVAAETKVEPAVLTPEEMALQKQRFLAHHGWAPDPDAKAEKEAADAKAVEDEAKPDAEPAAEEEPKDDEKPVESVKEPAKKPAPAIMVAPDAEPIAPITMEPLDAAPAPAPKPETKPDDFVATLPSEYRRDLEVLAFMERTNPNFAGIQDKMLSHYRREDAYITKWETQHPDEKFNPDAEDHAAFYQKSIPAIDPGALDEARVDARVEKAVEAREKKRDATTDQKLERMDFQAEMTREMPKIAANSAAAFASMVEQSKPELAKLMDRDGQKIFTPEVLQAIEEADPVAAEAIFCEGEKLGIMTKELGLLGRFGSRYQVNERASVKLNSTGQKFYPHAELIEFAAEMEQSIAALPEAERTRDGKRFVPRQQYYGRVVEIQESKLDQARKNAELQKLRTNFYTLEDENIGRALVAVSAEKVKTELARIERAADQRTKKNGAKASNGTHVEAPKPTPVTQDNVAKPVSGKPATKPPSSASASDKTNAVQGEKPVGTISKEDHDKAMWG